MVQSVKARRPRSPYLLDSILAFLGVHDDIIERRVTPRARSLYDVITVSAGTHWALR